MSRGGSRNAVATFLVATALVTLTAAAACWSFANGFILYYGDAQAHLNISRGLIDSRTPGYDQLGTVWLPVLHVLCLPFVGNDWLWSTGLAGAIPVGLCFVLGGVCFFLAAHELYATHWAAAISLACLVLNPNLLYLAVIPMTEAVFLSALFAALLAILKFRSTHRRRWLVLAILASWTLSLTRYDGWFLIPFLVAWLACLAPGKKIRTFFVLGILASLAPAYWIFHSWWETGHALDFYSGPYSAKAIQASKSYPGYHDWFTALHYYSKTSQLCAGSALLCLGLVGFFCAYRRRALSPLLFLALTPFFYVWSMHSSGGTPIHIPPLWPYSYYNSRYGIAAVPLCALAAGAIVISLPDRHRQFALLLPLLAVSPWLAHPSRQSWICWKESEVNSVDRRAWTAAGVHFLQTHYRPGQTILTSVGDVTGIYCRARIHLSQTINIGNGPTWFLATLRPDLFHPAPWVVLQQGDALEASLKGARAPYAPVASFPTSQYSPTLRILKRKSP